MLTDLYQDNDPSMHKCSVAAKEILRAIVTLYSSSFDIALLVPFLCFAWAVAGRTLVRELAIKEAKGIREGCDALRASVTTILAAMRAYATGLGSKWFACKRLGSVIADPLFGRFDIASARVPAQEPFHLSTRS